MDCIVPKKFAYWNGLSTLLPKIYPPGPTTPGRGRGYFINLGQKRLSANNFFLILGLDTKNGENLRQNLGFETCRAPLSCLVVVLLWKNWAVSRELNEWDKELKLFWEIIFHENNKIPIYQSIVKVTRRSKIPKNLNISENNTVLYVQNEKYSFSLLFYIWSNI